MDAILTQILHFLIEIVLAPLNGILVAFATAGELHDLFGYPGVSVLIAGAQGIAWAILATRTAWEAFQLATLRNEGAPTDPGALVKRVVLTAAAITAGPWLTLQALYVGNDLAQAVAHAGLGTGLAGLSGQLSILTHALVVGSIWRVLLLLCGILIIALCFMQAIVRTIEITLAAIVAPVMALGFLGGGGTADVWWRELLVLASAQGVQLTLLYLAASLLMVPAPTASGFALSPFLFVGACWVAWRTPHILRQYAYHSGAGGALGNAGGMAANTGVRMLLAKLPF